MRAGQRSTLLVATVVVALALALLLVLGCGGLLPTTETEGTSTSTRPPDQIETTTTSTAVSPLGRQTIGLSVQGRPIELFGLGSGSSRVLVIGGIHGDETGGEVARKLLSYLEKHPDALPKGVRLQVVPSANPDGEAAETRGNANDVDINRNFPSRNWSGTLDTEDPSSAGLTGGPSPGSEPETKALLACLANGCDLVVSLHSSGGIIDYDGAEGLPIAERMSAISGLPVRHLDYQAHVTGSLGTYVPERYEVPVITVELEGAALTTRLRTALLTALGP